MYRRLKEEVRNNEDKLLTAETNISQLLTHLEYEKEDILHDIMGSRSKLKWLGVWSIHISGIKNSFCHLIYVLMNFNCRLKK